MYPSADGWGIFFTYFFLRVLYIYEKVLYLHIQKQETMTIITEFNRSKFEGFKFEFVLNGIFGKFLSIATTPQEAILEYVDFFGVQPNDCKQVSKYPTRN